MTGLSTLGLYMQSILSACGSQITIYMFMLTSIKIRWRCISLRKHTQTNQSNQLLETSRGSFIIRANKQIFHVRFEWKVKYEACPDIRSGLQRQLCGTFSGSAIILKAYLQNHGHVHCVWSILIPSQLWLILWPAHLTQSVLFSF